MELAARLTSSAVADPTGLTLPTGVLGAALGAVLLVIGIAHYRGYRWWVADPRNVRLYTVVTQYTVLAMAWLGAALLLGVASAPLPSVIGTVAVVLGAICGLVGFMGLFWLPRFLRPPWLRTLQARTDPRPTAKAEIDAVDHPGAAPLSREGATMTEPPNPTVTGGGVTLAVPKGWEQVDRPGTQLAIAGPPFVLDANGTTFRPSMNVLVADAAPDADIRTLGTEALAAAHVVAEGVHVLAYDMWLEPDEKRGRRLQFTYQQGDVPLCVVQWIVLRDAVVTTLTATYPVAQLLQIHRLCDDVASLALGPRVAR